ncbi:patatin-like phospholipase family protein [Rhizobium leguminosarum]|uniref:patatin-like phospholipase family protein n=1 Tax=Rhizobium leguminosarum TaxID=384 RepID=UPI0013E3F1DB|nr:patatin-like phospholipase family protein [Rhizobium leguminosarum]
MQESKDASLPTFKAAQFALIDPPECDMIMKGGITSGIVYPYAVLQIATMYRLRSLGGTSAGAIAAAFAAAAEYGRLNGRPEAFLILKDYCDKLPAQLSSLFQASPELEPAVRLVQSVAASGSVWPVVRTVLGFGAIFALTGSIALGVISHSFDPNPYPTFLAAGAGALFGLISGLCHSTYTRVLSPLRKVARVLPQQEFGFCTGLTQPGNSEQGLTDWIHSAIQHIAFGDKNHPTPLTFGHLQGPNPDKPEIDLKVVTTNLSMRRPHTLPRLGVRAGYFPSKWQKIFPEPVMQYLADCGSRPWRRHKDAWIFPYEEKLPVVVAVRMSLSFPVLFTAVPLQVEDRELPSIVNSLGGKPYKRIRTALFSDGGISSNFPIHMFDGPLPVRPTFAFSLEDLLWDHREVKTRVALPRTAGEGMGVQVKQICTFKDFGWQVLSSAKDWQDQLLSEMPTRESRTDLLNEERGRSQFVDAAPCVATTNGLGL